MASREGGARSLCIHIVITACAQELQDAAQAVRWLREGGEDGPIRAEARLDKDRWPGKEDVPVPVVVYDRAGEEVVRACISMHVSPRPGARS